MVPLVDQVLIRCPRRSAVTGYDDAVPTFEAHEQFWHAYDRVTPREQRLFRDARRVFIQALRTWEAGGCVGAPREGDGRAVKRP